jgi:cobalt-precorrin-5B (C1)-methyltransferase
LKWGLTTGTCASLATKAAILFLIEGVRFEAVSIVLPDGESAEQLVYDLVSDGEAASATVIKDAGDDPDVTHGTRVIASVRLNSAGEVRFIAGLGVGTVTRAGLSIPPGEAAINPGPRTMIRQAVKEVTDLGVDVTISVPQGLELAQKTFNPRLGIEGGISILGTTGRVRPFSAAALQESLKCALDVFMAEGLTDIVLAPGNMGNGAALMHFDVQSEQIVDVSNEWGYMLQEVEKCDLRHLLIVGHPGKLAKLAMGQWQTHSSFSTSAVPFVTEMGQDLLPPSADEANTVEELFMTQLESPQREQLANRLAAAIAVNVVEAYPELPPPHVVLINLKRTILGSDGDPSVWRKQ